MRAFARRLAWIFLTVGTIQGADSAERKVVYRQPPEYPTIAAQMNIHGTVRLKVWVTSDGIVRRVEYIGGHPSLAESAVKAVKNWKYQPQPTESTLQLDVKF